MKTRESKRHKDAPSAQAMKWMMEARGKILATLAELYEIHEDYIDELILLEESSRQRDFDAVPPNDLKSNTGHICGIAFSLWRSAFLIYELGPDSRGSEDIVKHQRELLLQLARDNAATFTTEKATRVWMTGFHLNNARDRLFELFKRLGPKEPQLETNKPYDHRMSRTRDLSEEWNAIHIDLKNFIRDLRVELENFRNQGSKHIRL